jgi:hypothetical protein
MRSREQRIVGGGILAAVVLIVATAIVAPPAVERDSRPTTYNTGDSGAKAAFLALRRIGYETQRWQRPAAELDSIDAAHTTLVVASPLPNIMADEAIGMNAYVRRGGWILATDLSAAYSLLPEGPRPELSANPCSLMAEGFSTPAQVRKLQFKRLLSWTSLPANVDFAQSCGDRAGVLLFHLDKGTIVVWSESTPLTNAGLKDQANVALLLASLNPAGRHVLFDEYTHDYRDYLWSKAEGTPIGGLQAQLALVAILLVFSFARRHGPLRELLHVPRTSPLEFAHSMGNLYHRAGAGEAAIDEARGRLFVLLQERCGISRDILERGAEPICHALNERFGFRDPALPALLSPRPETSRIGSSAALREVKALHRIVAELNRIVNNIHSQRENTQRA